MNRVLVVVEDDEEVRVVWADDPEDWLVRFDKNGDFPAREWAENMIRVYHRRLSGCSGAPPTPPGHRPTSYHSEG